MSWSRHRNRCRFRSPSRRSTPRVRRVVLAMVAVGLLAAGSSFAQPQSPTLVWLAAHSSDVVRGRVVSLESSWTEDRTQIVTEVRIAVEEVLKGDAALEVRLVQPGGQVGDIAQISPQAAVFSVGEEALVFAQVSPDSVLRLASFAEGKIGLQRDDRGLWVSPETVRQLVPEMRFEVDADHRVRWHDFARVVRSALEGGGEAGLHRRQSPSLGNIAAPASPVPGQPIENEGFHVVSPAGAMLCPSEPSPFVHWDLRQFPGCRVPYEINPNLNNPGIAVAAFVNEVHAAAAKWNAVGPSHISLFDVNPNSSCVPNNNDGLNCVGWVPNFPWGTLVGWTTIWLNVPSGRILEVDSFLNPNTPWLVTPNPLPNPCPQVRGIQSTLIHELGHFVGLGHSEVFANPAPACGNDDPNMVTKMYSDSTYLCQITLQQADKDGINYLYTHDLGDLPDPPYPTRVHQNVNSGRTLSGVKLKVPNDGPSHLFGIYRDPDPAQANFPRYQYEWLAFDDGAIDDHPQECEARPVDNFDDGVTFKFKCVNGKIQGLVTVLVSVKTSADVRGRVHTYNLNNRMYLNGWFDWNGDGDFNDLLEYGIGQGAGSFAITAAGGYVFQILPPPNTPCDFASRFRLDWREDVGQVLAIDNNAPLSRERYAAQHGEVEDYPTPPQFPIPVYCHPKEVPVLFGGSGRTVSLLHLCHPPKVSSVTAIPAAAEFPPGGLDCMHSTMTVGLDIDFDSFADEMVGLTGDVCVNRSDPFVGPDGLRVIQTEMVSLDMTGTSELAGDLHVGLAGPSPGQIEQSPEAAAQGFDVSGETPASTYFDVLFVVDSELYGSSGPVGPLRVEGEIGAVPPGEVIGEPPPPPPTEGDPDAEPGVLPPG